MADGNRHGQRMRVCSRSATRHQERVWHYPQANHHSKSTSQFHCGTCPPDGAQPHLIRTLQIRTKDDLDPDFKWSGLLSAVRRAVVSTVHTTLLATPTQLVFGRDALLNISFQADWEYIKERKQKLIRQNNHRENATRKPYTYGVGDRVMIMQDPNRKHGSDRFIGPFTVTQVNNNGTVKLSKNADTGGAVHETWNIRNLEPCLA